MIDDVDRKALGDFIQKQREARGLRQSDLAEQLGISQSRLCQLESGRHWPLWPVVKRLSQVLKIPLVKFPGKESHDTPS